MFYSSLRLLVQSLLSFFLKGTESLRVWADKRFGVKPLASVQVDIEKWLASYPGGELLKEEADDIVRCLSGIRGQRLMQMSVCAHCDFLTKSPVAHSFVLSSAHNEGAAAVTRYEQLPLPAKSVDAAILHHVLDFSTDPHQLLRESARVLTEHGYLVVVGFNPFSFYGLYKGVLRYLAPQPNWCHHSLRLGRVKDWLQLLDFQVLNVGHGFCRPPLQQMGIMRHLRWIDSWVSWLGLPLGGYYIILARKDVAPLTPIKPLWRALPTLAASPSALRSIRRKSADSIAVKGEQ